MRTILLVEDYDAIRGSIGEELEEAGYKVLAVPTTTDGLRELKAGHSFDLAIVDVKMPPNHPHGFAFGRMARLRRPDVRLVFMTGDAGVAEADGDPPGPVLLKPVSIEELIRVLEAEFGA